MAELDRPILTVELEELGTQQPAFLTNITKYEITSDYLTPTDAWSFTLYDDEDPQRLRRTVTPLQPVKLYIDGNLQVVGRIDGTTGEGDSRASLRVYGRDYIADLVDGGADPSIKFKKSQDIGDAILSVTQAFGVVSMGSSGFNLTRNILTGRKPFGGAPRRDVKAAKLDEFKIGYNEGAFEAINKIAARYGYTLQPMPRRDWIALCEPEYRQSPLYRLTRGSATGNIVAGSGLADRNYANVPTLTLATGRNTGGQSKQSALKKILSTFGLNAPSEVGKNPEVRRIVYSETGTAPRVLDLRWDPKLNRGVPGNKGMLYRPLYYRDTDSRNTEQLERGVRRMISERLRHTLTYTCTVRGHTDPDSGATWAVDTIADVYDEVEDVNEPLWIKERTLRNDGSGPMTDLVLIRPHSFEL